MVYFATAFARTDDGWTGAELDLGDAEDIDTVADMLRELVGEEQGDGLAVLFVEEDDEWLGIVRLDRDEDPKVFLSDARVVEHSPIAVTLWGDVPAEAPVDDDDDEAVKLASDPAGEPDLLSDLGTPADRLLKLCASERLLPADVISELCDKAGCGEALESLREG